MSPLLLHARPTRHTFKQAHWHLDRKGIDWQVRERLWKLHAGRAKTTRRPGPLGRAGYRLWLLEVARGIEAGRYDRLLRRMHEAHERWVAEFWRQVGGAVESPAGRRD